MTDDQKWLAQAVHDIGAALWFGGSVMGVAGVNKSGSDLSQGLDRIRVAGSAWNRFAPAQWGGVAATLISGLWLTGSNARRLAVQEGYARVGAVKAALTVAGAAATGYAAYSGRKIGQLAEEAQRRGETVETTDATLPSAGTPPEVAAWQRKQRFAQVAVPVLAGGVITCNAWLVQAYRSGATVRGVLNRLTPG
jgi:putative copper export protein